MYLVKAAPNRHPLTCQQPPRVCRSQIPSIPPNLNTPAAPFPSKSTPYSSPKHPCGSGFPASSKLRLDWSIGRIAFGKVAELGTGTPVQPKTSPIAPQANPDPLISQKPTPLTACLHVCTHSSRVDLGRLGWIWVDSGTLCPREGISGSNSPVKNSMPEFVKRYPLESPGLWLHTVPSRITPSPKCSL